MPAFETFHLNPFIARTLERLGWSPDDPLLRESVPTVARGHNLVAVTPPSPAYATATLAGVLSRNVAGRLTLVLVPAAQLEEWGAMLHELARETELGIHAARGVTRAMRHLRDQAVDVLVTTPEIALTMVSRSAVPMDSVGSFFLAWPEMLPDEDAITPLMQDLPKDAQRIVYTSELERSDILVERYARKALVVKAAELETPAGPVRTVGVAWSNRVRGLADLIELLDPASLTVWTVDRRQHEAIGTVTVNQAGVRLATGDAPSGDTIVAFDLPTAPRLRQLLTAGEVVLLVPPGSERYVGRIAAPRRPLQLPGALEVARSAEATQRATIQKAIEGAQQGRALFTLAPLFERHEPQVVAAALYDLWTSSAPAAAPEASEAPATAKVYVGWGKKDGANPNELVAVLTKELRVDRNKIGRIELREAYSLVELPAQEVEPVAAALNGKTIRRKRVTAHVDRGVKPGSTPRSRRETRDS